MGEDIRRDQEAARARLGATPRLNKPIHVLLSPEDVMRVMAIVLDSDRDEAFDFIAGRLEKLVQKELRKPG